MLASRGKQKKLLTSVTRHLLSTQRCAIAIREYIPATAADCATFPFPSRFCSPFHCRCGLCLTSASTASPCWTPST
eukprot:scaffold295811_cov15-Tisochrysis_lutea.AAC.1